MTQETLFKYVDAASESTKRARVVILVMMVASVVAFSATWNSLGTGWLNSRLAATRGAERWWSELAAGTDPTLPTRSGSDAFAQARDFAALQYKPYTPVGR